MKFLLALTILLSANAFAMSPRDCNKLEAFKANQQSKLLLSRYTLGLLSAAQLDAEQKAQRQKLQAAWVQCGASK